ncbi:hypothetical protein [Cysteiniphilum halobium]|uniref:hypothetical protein n=1 Tax=Cysteiniphilum halobium TaxID=2219059 RepID=UPI003F85A011
MQTIKKYLMIPFFVLLVLDLSAADTTGKTNDQVKVGDSPVTQSCSAKTSDCNFGNNWELFKQNVSDAASSGAQVAKDAANKAGDYAQQGWDKTKLTTKEGWQNTKDASNEAWEKTKKVAAEGWQNTKEAAQKGAEKVDRYFNANKGDKNQAQEPKNSKNQVQSQ